MARLETGEKVFSCVLNLVFFLPFFFVVCEELLEGI